MNRKNERSRKLTQIEMEYEMDHCQAPYDCPKECWKACVGCLQNLNGGVKHGRK